MTKEERQERALLLQRYKDVAKLVQSPGWQWFVQDFTEKRAQSVRFMTGSYKDHPTIARYAGFVSALDDVLSWADKVVAKGESVLKNRSDNSSDDEEPQ